VEKSAVQLGGKSEGLVRQGKVAPWRCADKGVKLGDSKTLLCSQKLAFEFVINNGGNDHSATAKKATREPFGDSDSLGAALGMYQEAERA
jgi:hypothetical protein